MRRLRVIALLAIAGIAAGCNTISGLGKDLQAAGDWITGAVKQDKPTEASPAPIVEESSRK
ncbi:MAG TPA: entericidin [Burkholderiaceae bacterium]|nr:entericidin [Burkholderiaceae bacterium]